MALDPDFDDVACDLYRQEPWGPGTGDFHLNLTTVESIHPRS